MLGALILLIIAFIEACFWLGIGSLLLWLMFGWVPVATGFFGAAILLGFIIAVKVAWEVGL